MLSRDTRNGRTTRILETKLRRNLEETSRSSRAYGSEDAASHFSLYRPVPRTIVKLPERLRLVAKLASVGRRCLVEKSRFDVGTAEKKRGKRRNSR